MNEAQLFTVRVWRQAEQFRASVRAVGDEEAHLFTSPAPLADFLVHATAEPSAATAPALASAAAGEPPSVPPAQP